MAGERTTTARVRRGSLRALIVLALAVGSLVVAPAPARADWGTAQVAGFTPRPGGGWYLVYPNGTVEAGGGAPHRGDMRGRPLTMPITGIAATPSGKGYWLVAADGGIFSFGDAHFYGSTGALRLRQPIVDMAPTRSGDGYWLVAADGGIFSFGDARFRGSTGGMRLNRPIVGMASTRSGRGYWLVAADGGIFTFGDARFHGSTGAIRLFAPIVGMARNLDGEGYWLVGADGGIFSFGDARFFGTPFGRTFGFVIGMTRRVDRGGYVIVDTGGHHTYGRDTGPAGKHHRAGAVSPASVTDRIAFELVSRANDERAVRGIPRLGASAALSADAEALAARMAASGRLEHLVDFGTLMPRHGATAAGENIAYTGAADSPASVHLMWMHSDYHRRNMLNRGFDTIGVGAACRGGTVYVSMLLLRTSGSGALESAIPPTNPIARGGSNPASNLHC
jgi:hypothetical protein